MYFSPWLSFRQAMKKLSADEVLSADESRALAAAIDEATPDQDLWPRRPRCFVKAQSFVRHYNDAEDSL